MYPPFLVKSQTISKTGRRESGESTREKRGRREAKGLADRAGGGGGQEASTEGLLRLEIYGWSLTALRDVLEAGGRKSETRGLTRTRDGKGPEGEVDG